MTAAEAPIQDSHENLLPETRLFAEKAARSISEIQDGVNNIADIVVFLEILGYDDRIAIANGFKNLQHLAKYIYGFTDHYEDKQKAEERHQRNQSLSQISIPTMRQRFVEAVGINSPWLAALIVLNITGLSLWMAQKLPIAFTTAFTAGVFLGIIVTEGPLQMFSRLFFTAYDQKNYGEIRRVINRSYLTIGLMITCVVAIIFVFSAVARIPLLLTIIASAAVSTISFHRVSYAFIFTLKKVRELLIAYASAFSILLLTYFVILPSIMLTDKDNIAEKYFISLSMSFVALSLFALYYHYKILTKKAISNQSTGPVPQFYTPPSPPAITAEKTIPSNFFVQFWESLPFFLLGIFYFIMIFGDRILSWIFNPNILITENGTKLPLVFNSEYHAGADIALLALIPSSIIQYIVVIPLYALTLNKIETLKVSEITEMNTFLKAKYRQLILLTVISSAVAFLILNIIGADIVVSTFGGSETSLQIMRLASIGNVFIAIFGANSIYMIFLNQSKIVAFTSILSSVVLAIAGGCLGQQGYQNIVIAYLLSSLVAAILSTLLICRMLMSDNPSFRFFARYS